MIVKKVDIKSEEFRNAVLDLIRQANVFTNDIKNPRFERLRDGWIKDLELDIEWGPSSSESMNFSKAQEYCKNLGGRLPDVDELQTILDRTLYNPTCDKNIFKDVKSEYYWTSTKYMGCSNASWCVSFVNGNVATTSGPQ